MNEQMRMNKWVHKWEWIQKLRVNKWINGQMNTQMRMNKWTNEHTNETEQTNE